jgi:hypothetical protein
LITYNTFKQRVCPLEERLAMLDVPKVKQIQEELNGLPCRVGDTCLKLKLKDFTKRKKKKSQDFSQTNL